MNATTATPSTSGDSLVAYYTNLHFNPVPIEVENPAIWQRHFDKRRNLYERHLGLPLALLRGASVLEFGPNSGENALLPALFGALLTLVEPNQQVLPRLRDLFSRFNVCTQIESLTCAGIDNFDTARSFDLVVAEGFLYTLPNRDTLLRKIASLVSPGHFGVISYNDRCGGFLEYLRRAILFRACELRGVSDVQSNACLDLARELYQDDCSRLNMSRPFEVWWRDTLVNPFCRSQHTWSLPDLLTILHEEGCEFYSSSPAWLTCDLYGWYKNAPSAEIRRQQVLSGWRRNLGYFLTGLAPQEGGQATVTEKVISDVSGLVESLCDWKVVPDRTNVDIQYPKSLARYLTASTDTRLQKINEEWQQLISALRAPRYETLRNAYAGASLTRDLWGTAYHYLCFQRSMQATPAGFDRPGRNGA